MFQFFDKLGYPVSFAQVDHYHAQKIDRQSALPKAQKENGDRIQFTLTFHLTTTQLNPSFRTWGSLHGIRFDPLHRHHFCVARRPTRQEELPDLFESNPVQHARCLLILANKVSDVGKHKDNETLAWMLFGFAMSGGVRELSVDFAVNREE